MLLSTIVTAIGALIGMFHPNRTIQHVIQEAQTVAGAVDQTTGGDPNRVGQAVLDLGKGHILTLLIGLYKAKGADAVRAFLTAEEKYVEEAARFTQSDVAAIRADYEAWVAQTLKVLSDFANTSAVHDDLNPLAIPHPDISGPARDVTV